MPGQGGARPPWAGAGGPPEGGAGGFGAGPAGAMPGAGAKAGAFGQPAAGGEPAGPPPVRPDIGTTGFDFTAWLVLVGGLAAAGLILILRRYTAPVKSR